MKKQLSAEQRMELLKQYDEMEKEKIRSRLYLNRKSGSVYKCIGYKDAEKLDKVGFIFDKANIEFDPYTIERIVAYKGDPFMQNFIPMILDTKEPL